MNYKTSGGGEGGTVHFWRFNERGGGGGGGGYAVHFRPVQRAGGGGGGGTVHFRPVHGRGEGCCPRTTACEKWIKEGLATSKTPKTACKKKDFGHKGGLQPPTPPPPNYQRLFRPCRNSIYH